MSVNINKFGTSTINKFGRTINKSTIRWKPGNDLKYPAQKKNPTTWEIFTQAKISIPANGFKIIIIPFGFTLIEGAVIIALKQELKYRKVSIHNEIILESVDHIIITIQNNSSNSLAIDENVSLCFIHYHR